MDTRPEWAVAYATIGLAIATLFLAFVAALQDKIRQRLTRPRLELEASNSPPDCLKMPISVRVRSSEGVAFLFYDAYYFRVRVRNSGSQRAELVEVYAKELLKKQANDAYRRVQSFVPMNLLWANVKSPFLEAISPQMEKYCDLGHVIKPTERGKLPYEQNGEIAKADETVFSFEVESKPNTLAHLVGPGTYRIVLVVGAANASPIERTVELNLTGEWYDDEARMLADGIGIGLA